MDLDLRLFANVLLSEKVENVLALVTLDLDDFAHFSVAHNGSIAAKLFFEEAQDFLQVEITGQPLHRGQRFASGALLDANVHKGARGRARGRGLALGLGKGIVGFEVFELLAERRQKPRDSEVRRKKKKKEKERRKEKHKTRWTVKTRPAVPFMTRATHHSPLCPLLDFGSHSDTELRKSKIGANERS